MKLTTALISLFAAADAAYYSKEQYESGAVHQMILDEKNVSVMPIH